MKSFNSKLAVDQLHARAIEKTLTKIDSSNSIFFEHDVVAQWLNSWGIGEETDFFEFIQTLSNKKI